MTTWPQEYNSKAQEEFQRKLVSAEEAVSHIKSGDFLYISTGQNPSLLLTALAARKDELRGVTYRSLPGADYGWYTEDWMENISHQILYAGASTREPLDKHIIDFVPWFVHSAWRAFDEGRPDAPNLKVTMLRVSPPNEHGYCCTGYSVWESIPCARRCRQNGGIVLAEVDENIIRTHGQSWIHVSEIDYFVENHIVPPQGVAAGYPDPEPGQQEIANNVSTLIKDRDTLQIGTGSHTGNLVRLGALDNKNDLGMFAELTVPGTIEAVKKGIINGKYANLHPGKAVFTTAGNDIHDWAFINNNPAFEFYGTDYIHDPMVISKNNNMVAINGALVIDLTGQIGAMGVGPSHYSGTGGHLAYAMGAFFSKGGRYITVVLSTARGGTVSRIVPQLPLGQAVTVPRDLADIVVTDYGIARLLNHSARERAEALINIAHPDFRAELRKEAQKLFWP